MIRTLNTTTGRYEAEPIKSYKQCTDTNRALDVAKQLIEDLNKVISAKDELLAQASQCRSITQVRKLLS
jgi:hypothetical protein